MADFSGLSFGATVDMLSNAISGASMNHEQLANNVANLNTPNYRRSTVSFRDALAATEAAPPDPNELSLATDDGRQFAINGEQPAQPFDPKPSVDRTTQGRVDRSNVDIDQEMAQLGENASYSEDMAQLLQIQFMRYREAISEQPR